MAIAMTAAGSDTFGEVELHGTVRCVAVRRHRTPNAQLRDTGLTREPTGRMLALFRCTQILLHDRRAIGAVPRRFRGMITCNHDCFC